jgi:hypothetical protein
LVVKRNNGILGSWNDGFGEKEKYLWDIHPLLKHSIFSTK